MTRALFVGGIWNSRIITLATGRSGPYPVTVNNVRQTYLHVPSRPCRLFDVVLWLDTLEPILRGELVETPPPPRR